MKIAQITDLHWRHYITGTSLNQNRHSRIMPFLLEEALQYLKSQQVEFICLTGDLVDAPLDGHLSQGEEKQVLKDYRAMKRCLDKSEIPYLALPGNHDLPELFFKVFKKEKLIKVHQYEIIPFYEYQIGSSKIYRDKEEWENFLLNISREGPKNQIHLQHYLIHIHKNKYFPHTYENAKALMEKIKNSKRVLLSLSGHLHSGSPLKKVGGTYFQVGSSFSEYPYPCTIYDLSDTKVKSQEIYMAEKKSKFLNPYEGKKGRWFKGNLHSHCREGSRCSSIPLEDSVHDYRERGYHFLAITDHDKVSPIENIKKKYSDMIFFRGFEHSESAHMLFIEGNLSSALKAKDKALAIKNSNGSLSIVCHPDGPRKGYWKVKELMKYPMKPIGIEIFNGHYSVNNWRKVGGGWEYTNFWDELLEAGIYAFGYANDDFHDGLIDLGNGYNCVLAETLSSKEILSGLKEGAFYASTGLHLHSIYSFRGKFVINMDSECQGRFIGPGGKKLMEIRGKSFEVEWKGESYFRFEADENGKKCWLQPIRARKLKENY